MVSFIYSLRKMGFGNRTLNTGGVVTRNVANVGLAAFDTTHALIDVLADPLKSAKYTVNNVKDIFMHAAQQKTR